MIVEDYIQTQLMATPGNPPTGYIYHYYKADGLLYSKTSAGVETKVNKHALTNYSVVAQSPVAATRTYITGSSLTIPVGKLQVGTSFRWTFNLTKTGAGIAASTFDITIGTVGTTTDSARLSFTKPAGTAVIDEGKVTIEAVVRTIGATGVMVGEFTMIHNLAATGHMVIPTACVNTISAGFDMTVANLIVGLCITSGGADAVTIQMVQAEAWNV